LGHARCARTPAPPPTASRRSTPPPLTTAASKAGMKFWPNRAGLQQIPYHPGSQLRAYIRHPSHPPDAGSGSGVGVHKYTTPRPSPVGPADPYPPQPPPPNFTSVVVILPIRLHRTFATVFVSGRPLHRWRPIPPAWLVVWYRRESCPDRGIIADRQIPASPTGSARSVASFVASQGLGSLSAVAAANRVWCR
jgi:hypothetical protein